MSLIVSASSSARVYPSISQARSLTSSSLPGPSSASSCTYTASYALCTSRRYLSSLSHRACSARLRSVMSSPELSLPTTAPSASRSTALFQAISLFFTGAGDDDVLEVVRLGDRAVHLLAEPGAERLAHLGRDGHLEPVAPHEVALLALQHVAGLAVGQR